MASDIYAWLSIHDPEGFNPVNNKTWRELCLLNFGDAVFHGGQSAGFVGFLSNNYPTSETKVIGWMQLFGDRAAGYLSNNQVSVTFKVDMSLETVSAEGVHLVGDFQGWNPATTPMTTTGNGIYTAEVSLEAGSYHTYKFVNGNTLECAEIVSPECGVDDGFGNYKRFINVPVNNHEPGSVCFNHCSGCFVQHQITIPPGWNSLSSYVMPIETDIETLLSSIFPELITLQTMTDVYFPAGGINTIVNWESQSAYKIKVDEEVTLTVIGLPEENKTLNLAEGWKMIPVISDQPLEVAGLFGGIATMWL